MVKPRTFDELPRAVSPTKVVLFSVVSDLVLVLLLVSSWGGVFHMPIIDSFLKQLEHIIIIIILFIST